MRNIVNLMHLEPGTNISMAHGATGEVIANPKDGVWVTVRFLTSPEDPSLVGTEDMVFAADIVDILDEH